MYCLKCGTKLSEDARFCPRCGTPVPGAAEQEREANPFEKGTSGGYSGSRGNSPQKRSSASGNSPQQQRSASGNNPQQRRSASGNSPQQRRSTSGKAPKKPNRRRGMSRSWRIALTIVTAAVFAVCVVAVLFATRVSQAPVASADSQSVSSNETGRGADAETSGGTLSDDNTNTSEAETGSGTAASSEGEAAAEQVQVATWERPSLFNTVTSDDADTTVPQIAYYEVAADLSNISNRSEFYLNEEEERLLAANGFYVEADAGGREFYELYENNRYNLDPNYVTVDSMMHTYHLYFQYLMKNTEKNHLSSALADVSQKMLAASSAQYDALAGTEWEGAAARNCGFFAVASTLLGTEAGLPASVSSAASQEIQLISEASQITDSPLTGQPEDYSQFQVRGYYEGDATLEAYFKAMMWYGTMSFSQDDEDLSRSAVLMALAMNGEAKDGWEAIYTVTSFFAGASDDLGYYEYLPAVQMAYGDGVTVSDLPGNSAAWETCKTALASLEAPKINTLTKEDELAGKTTKKAFRFMGQRFTLDSEIFENLLFDKVGENAAGENRMLPDALDIPAAFGSDTALSILTERGATGYDGYSENLTELRDSISQMGDETWTASLYSRWLYTLEPLLDTKGDGYPSFMQTDAWNRKNLSSYLGSYTELKHDTVLYAKQVMVEMGGDIDNRDDRGYVEAEPEVFRRLSVLTEATKNGLAGYGFLESEASEDLDLLKSLSDQLQTIADKELGNELPTDAEFELIRGYGGQIEHFWYNVYKNEPETGYMTSKEFPAAVVTDVATNADAGTCLELGTGKVDRIAVVVPVDGSLRIAYGAVYSFYEFEQPISNRLTDTEWRQMMGIELDGSGSYATSSVSRQDWTDDFTYEWSY